MESTLDASTCTLRQLDMVNKSRVCVTDSLDWPAAVEVATIILFHSHAHDRTRQYSKGCTEHQNLSAADYKGETLAKERACCELSVYAVLDNGFWAQSDSKVGPD